MHAGNALLAGAGLSEGFGALTALDQPDFATAANISAGRRIAAASDFAQ